MSDSAIVICSYDLYVLNKSSHQSSQWIGLIDNWIEDCIVYLNRLQ
jgi:hypothetical protein